MSDSYKIKDQHAAYFITFQVVGWADVFSRLTYRDIILESLEYCRQNKSLELYAYVIMTNHVHAILRSKEGKLSELIRDFKKHTSRQILSEINCSNIESRKDWLEMIFRFHAKLNKRVGDKQLWTHENHAVELYNNEMLHSKINYIHNNPVRAGWVEKPEDYLHSSARNYAGLDALIDIEMI